MVAVLPLPFWSITQPTINSLIALTILAADNDEKPWETGDEIL